MIFDQKTNKNIKKSSLFFTESGLVRHILSGYLNLSKKYGHKYGNSYSPGNLNLGAFFTGCLLIWIMASSVIFMIQGKDPILAQAKSIHIKAKQIIPEVKFAKIEKPQSQVLGEKEVAKPKSLPNPYLKFPETAKLFDSNPEFVLSLEQKISDYIDKYRSYEGLDNRYDVPVRSVVFLEASLKYQVPLSYTLSIARLESRFGTDCFSEANTTRICKHKNIYSLGLDDSGNNKTFKSWEDGVYGFGAWYQKRIDENYTTCQIWRRYNPNGDYCSKVLEIASDVERFFKA